MKLNFVGHSRRLVPVTTPPYLHKAIILIFVTIISLRFKSSFITPMSVLKNMIYLKSLLIYQISSSYCPFSYNLSVGNPGNSTSSVFYCLDFAGCTFLVQFSMLLPIGSWIQRIHETQVCISGKIIGGVS